MKETKVYIDELPESCSKCLFCYDNRPYWKSTDCIINHKELDEDEIEISVNENCPLQSIKTHDRELVKEVCKKIKEQLGFIVDGQERIVCDGSATGDKTILAVLKQIQKEFEK